MRIAAAACLSVVLTSCLGWHYAVPPGCHPGTRADSNLPVVEFPCTGQSPFMALVLTGDGGWRKIDHRVSDVFLENGIPVVGFLSNDYFRVRKTAEQTSSDIAGVLRTYLTRWRRSGVIIVGYSRGADAIPFVLHRLPADLAPRVRVAALLGPATTTDFHYTPLHLFGIKDHDAELPLLPEITADRGFRILCVYGDREHESLCPQIPAGMATVVRVSGGHHFAGGYHMLGERILEMAK